MQDSLSHFVVAVETVRLSGRPASLESQGVRRSNHGLDAGRDRIDGWWN